MGGVVDILATIFCLFGWLSGAEHRNPLTALHGGWTDMVTVVRVWAYSFGVIVVCAIVYWVMCRIPALDNLGRRNRSAKNEGIEEGHDVSSFQTRLDVGDDE